MLRLPTESSDDGVSRSVERDVSLEGDAAAEWLRVRGWAPEGSERSIRLAADAVRSEDFAAARLSHNVQRLTRQPGAAGIAGTILLEGTLDVRTADGALTISAGEGFLVDAGVAVELTSSRGIAALEFRSDAAFPARYGVTGVTSVQLLPSDQKLVRMLAGLANLVLASSEPDDDTWHFQRASVENLFAAVVATSAFGYVSTRSPARDRLLRAASTRIAERFRDPAFGVATLAAELSVSERSIQQAFAGAGTTAKRALTHARLRDARTLVGRAEGRPDYDEIAALSGFINARALRRALAASDGSDPTAP